MKQLISILLCIVMISQGIYQGIVYVFYTIKKDYVIEQYCINKNITQFNCKGKCHLKDMLHPAEVTPTEPHLESPLLTNLLDPNPVLLFWDSQNKYDLILSSLQQVCSKNVSIHFSYLFTYKYLFYKAFLNPPIKFTL